MHNCNTLQREGKYVNIQKMLDIPNSTMKQRKCHELVTNCNALKTMHDNTMH
uniref:Uncharacterized protein n=1 Tax=Arundo donax TaxID=35708 RepID=A0A0A9ET00_ARUDO